MLSMPIRRSWAGPILFSVCLLLLHHQVSSLRLTVADLPATKQSSKRLLAAITVNDTATSYFVTKQLQSYAEACEAGFEIHVVLITLPGVWDKADKILFPTASRYFCLRLHMLLPVVISTDLIFAEGESSLSHQHRLVFSQLAHKYDLFLSQEHDMDIRARHLFYWTHWRHVFKTRPIVPHPGRPVIPGFLRHEVSMRPLPAQNHSTWDRPAALVHIAAPLAILHVGNFTCFAPHKSHPGFYLVDRELLLLGMSKQAWKSDVNKTFQEYNVHHQSTWQWHYFHHAIPLAAMHRATVHHGSDKYTPGWIEASSNYTDDQFRDSISDGVDAGELEYLMTNCMGQPWDGSKLPFPYPSLQGNSTVIEYGWCRGWFPSTIAPAEDSGAILTRESGCLDADSPIVSPCAECALRGQGAALIYRLQGPTLAARPMKPKGLFLVDVMCIPGLAVQEFMPCKEAKCMDDLFINASNPLHH